MKKILLFEDNDILGDSLVDLLEQSATVDRYKTYTDSLDRIAQIGSNEALALEYALAVVDGNLTPQLYDNSEGIALLAALDETGIPTFAWFSDQGAVPSGITSLNKNNWRDTVNTIKKFLE